MEDFHRQEHTRSNTKVSTFKKYNLLIHDKSELWTTKGRVEGERNLKYIVQKENKNLT